MKSNIAHVALALMAVVFCGTLSAAPALWYKWRSKLNGQEFCAQTSPGQGWEKLPHAYTNARCKEKPDSKPDSQVPRR